MLSFLLENSLLFPQMSNLARILFPKSITPRMQTDILANNRYKKIYIILNTNQFKLYSYPDLLKENNFNLKRYLAIPAYKVFRKSEK